MMFTDMAGYTALMQRDEAAAVRSRERHRGALERLVPEHDGEVLQYFGDGSLCIFRSSLHAVKAAVEIQRDLGGEPPLRIGLHAGDIAYDEQGAYGDAINIAARLEALAVPGGILLSEKVFDDIKRHPSLATVPVGAVRLKNVAEAIRTYALSADGVVVPSDAPSVEAESTGKEGAADPLPPRVRRRLDERTRQPTFSTPTGTIPGRVPLVGREREVQALRALLDQAEDRRGITAFLRGPRGIGKSRLGQEAAEYSKTRGWNVLLGRAYPAEGMVPFAPFSDAFLPVLRGLEKDELTSLVPGGEDALLSLFPSLGLGVRRLPEADGQPGEPQARLFWQFASLVARLAEHKPLLLIIEDLDFADRSSIELLHFLARQCVDKPIVVIAEYTGIDPKRKREMMEVEQSLLAISAGAVFDLEPLSLEGTDEFIQRAFDIESRDTGHLAALVHQWTGGNPFFVTGTLRGLVEDRMLKREEGVWQGLELESIKLPHSLKDAVLSWMSNVSAAGLGLARLVAIVGTQVSYDVLRELSDADDDSVSMALDELVRHQILVDTEERFTLLYDFRHPLIRETIRSELSLVELRRLHHHVATRLEAYYGAEADRHADELAYHFGQAGQGAGQAIRYLSLAGHGALARYANREAVGYLQEALDRIEANPPGEPLGLTSDVSIARVIAGLAKARRRLGHVQASVALGRRVLALARGSGDSGAVASAHRAIGLALTAGGHFEEAIEEFQMALEAARLAADAPLVIRILLAQGFCCHAVGSREEAETAVHGALSLAEELEIPELVGRAHSTLMRLYIWTGRVDEVRAHAEKALAIGRENADATVEFWSQWAMGAMEGLIGNTVEMERRIEEARRIAKQVGSPLLRLEIAELEIELTYARGEWTEGLEIGQHAIELARSLDARTVLPRLLVWTSLIHLGRYDLEAADRLTSEAWDFSGAGEAVSRQRHIYVHTIVPAHIGRAAYYLTKGDWGEAARIAEVGLAIADRTGYVAWAVHHIIPIICEASIQARNLSRARELGTRMRIEAEAMGHPLALAWAEACDALLTWLEGDAARGAAALRRGAEALEQIPLVFEANRLRRQLAGRLAEVGDEAGALKELRRVHAVFSRLGARFELEKTIGQFGELGVEPPA